MKGYSIITTITFFLPIIIIHKEKMTMKKISILLILSLVCMTPAMAQDKSEMTEEQAQAAEMLKQIPDQYEKNPQNLKGVVDGGVPKGRWKEGLLFEGISPQPWLQSAANWYPNTEEVQPDEMRITFMGTTPIIRPGQMNTSILVELGNGEMFIFDIGEGSISNYLAAGHAFNELNNIFLTHLHVDHYGSLPYIYMFGAWGGRWHEPLRIFGPSGRTEKDGISYLVEGMKMMTHWHREAFSVFPIGEGWDVEVTEFDFMDDGGVIYDKNGVKVIHWRQSHAKDGASAYRLDWNGLSFAFTGDGRPNSLTAKHAEGVDILITELQTEVVAISSVVQGVPPFVGRYTIDTHHNPAYAAGYLANKVKPRLFLTTHMPFDPYLNEETVAEVREHWKGPYHFGAPDLIVVNVTKDQIWVRDGVVPDYPNITPPQAHQSIKKHGGLVVPMPQYQREDIQEPTIREAQIPPDEYYPEGYKPELMEQWPAEKPIFIPEDQVPHGMKRRIK
jgi:ribonuclease BN (tRNA processing enzyme)